jgi:hypothetical protein
LLDTLLAVDPAAAAATGREILGKPTTADEWALALRNVARGDGTADPDFLRAKTEELIRSHPVDGAVLMGGCDKTTPGLVMGALSAGLLARRIAALRKAGLTELKRR